MLPHQQRVIDEKHALSEKISNLIKFHDDPELNNIVPDIEERWDLIRQLDTMQQYERILARRIERFI